jgi:hypothetical protein
MPDTDWAHPSAMLRAMLTGDESGFGRLAAAAEGGSAADTFNLLLAVAFVMAVRRHFRDGYTAADVIRLVAELRSHAAQTAEAIDPVGAERVIRIALGESSAPDTGADEATKSNTQALALMSLVSDRDLSSEELDGFIADAVTEAGKARRPGRPIS